MGGYGSGRTGGKPIAERCRQLDIGWLAKAGKARDGEAISGDLHWSCCGRPSGSITYTCDVIDPLEARLILRFSCYSYGEVELVRQVIPLRFTVPNYGGRRWWMVCPIEHIPVAKLYMPLNGDRFASRAALRLGYRSQRIAPADKPYERLSRVERKLGWKRGFIGPPARPKGMWHRTFDRLVVEYDDIITQVDERSFALAKHVAPHLMDRI